MKPENQINLFGHNEILSKFIKLYDSKKLPSKILLSGNEGIGKCTLAYHLINYIFSQNDIEAYNTNKNIINSNSNNFKLIQNNIHPNFYKINLNDTKNSIDIAQIREMIKFIQKTSFNDQEKIILIDQIEYLNQNSANSILKILEDSNEKVLFILIHAQEKKIIETIKSRCINFKIFLDQNFISHIVNNYFKKNIFDLINNNFKSFYFSPKTYINFLEICNEIKFDYENSNIDLFIKNLIENKLYLKKNLIYIDIKQFIELYFRKKIVNHSSQINLNHFSYFNKKYYEFKKYNLDLESFFIEFNTKVFNE